MKYLINIIKLMIVIILSTIIFGTLSFFNILNDNICSIIQIIVLATCIFLLSYSMGKEKEKNGYIEGIIQGLITIILFLLINIIFKQNITGSNLIYYLFILLISISGSILGINKKTKV